MHLSWLKYLSSATPISYLRVSGVQEKRKPGAAMDSNFTFLHEYGYSPGTMDTRNLEAERAVNASGGERSEEKKKRLTAEQMELLERSFQEEVKLEPERKLRLAQELGLPPRQVTVWFQNRRARWKTKRLEHLYSTLKREFDAIAKEKEKLEEEVMNLKAQLEKKVQSCHGSITEAVEGDETVESTSTPPTQFTLNQFQASSCHNPHLVDYSSLLTIKDYYDLLATLP